jgi:hypothetical protein
VPCLICREIFALYAIKEKEINKEFSGSGNFAYSPSLRVPALIFYEKDKKYIRVGKFRSLPLPSVPGPDLFNFE